MKNDRSALSIVMLSREGNFLFTDKHLQAFQSFIIDAIYSKLVFKSKFHDPYKPQAGTFTSEQLWQGLLPFIRGLLSSPQKCWRERLNGHRPLMGSNYHKETNKHPEETQQDLYSMFGQLEMYFLKETSSCRRFHKLSLSVFLNKSCMGSVSGSVL